MCTNLGVTNEKVHITFLVAESLCHWLLLHLVLARITIFVKGAQETLTRDAKLLHDATTAFDCLSDVEVAALPPVVLDVVRAANKLKWNVAAQARITLVAEAPVAESRRAEEKSS